MNALFMKVFGIVGYSGSGKTTLIERLLPILKARGVRTSVIKHTHHDFEIDQPGKDSWRLRESGAAEVLLASDLRYALLHENHNEPPPTLQALLPRLHDCDLVLVEATSASRSPSLKCIAPQPASRGCFPMTRTSSRWQPMPIYPAIFPNLRSTTLKP